MEIKNKKGGKWNDPSIPKHNWKDDEINDLGSDKDYWITCEMCESKKIRYTHTMINENYDTELLCGCKCASKMEKDPNIPKIMEKRFKNLQKKVKNWQKKIWITSKKGNPFLIEDNIQFVIIKKSDGSFMLYAKDILNNKEYNGKKKFITIEEVKTAAFDAYRWICGKRNNETPGV